MDWQCIRTKWIDCSKKILWCNIAGDCCQNLWNEYSKFWEVRVEGCHEDSKAQRNTKDCSGWGFDTKTRRHEETRRIVADGVSPQRN